MKFYYTNAAVYLGSQGDPDKSLGGLISNTVVPNNSLGNLFGDISQHAIDEQLTETKIIALKNETGAAISGLQLWFVYPADAISKFEVAFVAPGKNVCNEYYFETIANMRATPYVGTFSEANGIGSLITIGNLAKDAYLGLWLRRTILTTATPTCDALYTNFLAGTPTVTKEDIILQLNWS